MLGAKSRGIFYRAKSMWIDFFQWFLAAWVQSKWSYFGTDSDDPNLDTWSWDKSRMRFKTIFTDSCEEGAKEEIHLGDVLQPHGLTLIFIFWQLLMLITGMTVMLHAMRGCECSDRSGCEHCGYSDPITFYEYLWVLLNIWKIIY